ncbi:hypothetical protein EJ03DRAFT_336425 [Teratosphaeria nubilosa]|uniref:Uncharacterized protein n=1 Tax=Teratosphaeria nubilosa TaxID=161662 RepID=A0A6G1L8L8_9PEZI|nr:hypothetical protein EJ03DRAFT_336425 [Teratosphaeria nubilosa]
MERFILLTLAELDLVQLPALSGPRLFTIKQLLEAYRAHLYAERFMIDQAEATQPGSWTRYTLSALKRPTSHTRSTTAQESNSPDSAKRICGKHTLRLVPIEQLLEAYHAHLDADLLIIDEAKAS